MMRHAGRLAANPRMALQAKNAARLDEAEQQAIRACAASLRDGGVA